MAYGVGEIDGHIVRDFISLEQNGDMSTEINFLAVNRALKLSGLDSDGLLGLSPKIRQRKANSETVDILIHQLASKGILQKAMFSLELNDGISNKDSHFYFGGYNKVLIAEAKTLRNPNIPEDASNRSKSDDGIFWMNINS